MQLFGLLYFVYVLTDDSVIATCGRDKTVRSFLSKIDFACVFAADGLIVSPMFFERVYAGVRGCVGGNKPYQE